MRLVEQGIVAKADFDSADATFKVAQSRYQDALEEIRNRQALLAQRRSELALARQQLTDTTVHAPIDGIVQLKRASVGEFLAAGAPVVDIVRMNPLSLQAQVPERDAATVRFGQNVRVSVEGDTRVYVGQIKRLSPVIAQQSRMLMVEADVQNDGNLRPGSFAKAEIVTNDAKMAVTVPNNAIVTFAGIEKVIVVQNGKALEKPITTGRRSGDSTEIVAGINVGEQVMSIRATCNRVWPSKWCNRSFLEFGLGSLVFVLRLWSESLNFELCRLGLTQVEPVFRPKSKDQSTKIQAQSS